MVIVDPEKIEWKRVEHLPKGAWTRVLRQDKETGIVVLLFRTDKGFRHPREKHSLDESGVVLEGKAVDDKGTEIKRGMYYFIPAGVEHGPFSTPEGCIIFIHLSPPKF